MGHCLTRISREKGLTTISNLTVFNCDTPSVLVNTWHRIEAHNLLYSLWEGGKVSFILINLNTYLVPTIALCG